APHLLLFSYYPRAHRDLPSFPTRRSSDLGGMLMGYHRYRGLMTPREYGQRVIAGEIEDPTVSMQLRRGFEPRAIIEEYYPEWKAGHAAVLLVHQPQRAQVVKRSRVARPGLGQEGALSALPVRRAAHARHLTGQHG